MKFRDEVIDAGLALGFNLTFLAYIAYVIWRRKKETDNRAKKILEKAFENAER